MSSTTEPGNPLSTTWLRPKALATVGLAAIFTFGVAVSLVTRGPFAWHFTRREAWQGTLEALALVAALFLALSLPRLSARWRVVLLFLPAALYLRRHHVDGVLLVSLLYIEAIIALGALLRMVAAGENGRDWLRNLIAGVALLSLLLWSAQVAGLGLPKAQRLLAAVVLIPCLIVRRRELLSLDLLRRALVLEVPAARLWAAVAMALFAVSFARTNTVADFDSLWYGLRPELVLVGERSVFEPLGFASPVHYFPKLYEVLLLPLSAMREYSVVQGTTVVFGALLAVLSFVILRRLGLDRVPALAGTITVWTIPALSSSTLGAKPDVFVALMIVAMCWFGWQVADGRRWQFAWVLCCASLAVSSKLIAIPYVAAAGFACLLALFGSRAPGIDRPARDASLALLLCVSVGLLVFARTFMLAGMPTIGPEQLVALWRYLGMDMHMPVGTLQWVNPQDWSDVPSILWGWVADPSQFSHIAITWPGNVWLLLPLLALMQPAQRAHPSYTRHDLALLWAVPLAGLALLVGIGFINRGGDGNYFIAPVVLATLAGLGLAWRRFDRRPLRAALLLSLGMIAGFQFVYGFVSTGWRIGTRAWDADFQRINRDSPLVRQHLLEDHGARELETFLRARPPLRLTGTVDPEMGFRLSARYEDLADIGIAHADKPDDLPTMLALLSCGRVDAVVLQADASNRFGPVGHAFLDWADLLPPEAYLHQDATWRVVDLRGRLPPCPSRTEETGTSPR